MRIFKSLSRFLLILGLAVLYDASAALAQHKKPTKVTIIKESYDADGNKTVQRIEKEGAEADAIDIDALAEGRYPRQQEFKFFGDGQDFNFGDFRSFFDSLGMGDFQMFGPDNWSFSERWSPFGDMEGASKPKLGVRVVEQENQAGVMVSEVVPGSAAEKAGIKEGDIILSVDDQDIDSVERLVQVVQSHTQADEVVIDIRRGEELLSLPAQLSSIKPKREIEIKKI